MTSVLVTGATGMLGTHLVLEAKSRVNLIAVSHQKAIRDDSVTCVQTDLQQAETVEELFRKFKPDCVVNCAALTDVDACEVDFETALALNRDLPERLAKASVLYDTKFIHISTDAVFDGKSGGYVEEDTPSPINRYGMSKFEGESVVLDSNPQALILRTNFFGWSPGYKSGLFEWFYRRLESGEIHSGFYDVNVSLISAQHLAAWILRLMGTDLHGVYHLAGSDCMSKYDFGKMIAAEFGFSSELIQPISVEEAGLKAVRPKNLCLRSERFATALNTVLPTVQEGLQLMRNSMEAGFRERLQALVVRDTPSLNI